MFIAGTVKPLGLAAAHRHVEVVDRRGPDALRGRHAADDPPGRALDFGRRAERAGVRQAIDERAVDGAAGRQERVSVHAAERSGGREDFIHGLELHDDESSLIMKARNRPERPLSGPDRTVDCTTGKRKSSTTAAAGRRRDHLGDRQHPFARLRSRQAGPGSLGAAG